MAKSFTNPAASRCEQWRGLLRRWRASGLSQAEFCRRQHLAVWQFAAWKRRLGGEDHAVGVPFVPVQVVASRPAGDVELSLPSGHVLRFNSDIDPAKLAAIAAALEATRREEPPC